MGEDDLSSTDRPGRTRTCGRDLGRTRRTLAPRVTVDLGEHTMSDAVGSNSAQRSDYDQVALLDSKGEAS